MKPECRAISSTNRRLLARTGPRLWPRGRPRSPRPPLSRKARSRRSMKGMSLSMVFGIPTTAIFRPRFATSCRTFRAPLSVPSPPTDEQYRQDSSRSQTVDDLGRVLRAARSAEDGAADPACADRAAVYASRPPSLRPNPKSGSSAVAPAGRVGVGRRPLACDAAAVSGAAVVPTAGQRPVPGSRGR